MWQILLHVTPTTVALTLAALTALALLTARARARDREATARVCRRVLAGAAGMYLLILAAPISSWEWVGTGERHVEWNPVRWAQELREPPAPEDSFDIRLRSGDTAHFSEDELTRAEREESQEFEPYDYFLHEDGRGELVITDAQGEQVDEAEERLVHQEAGPAAAEFREREHEGYESASLAVEEKAIHALFFVPIGILAFHAFRGMPGATGVSGVLAFGPLLSLSVQTGQWALAAHRTADAGDLLVQSVGSLTGTALAGASVLLMSRVPRRSEPEEEHSDHEVRST